MSRAPARAPLDEARDANTSEKRLAALAAEHASDLDILTAIAQHTNTSTKTLLEVAAAVPSVAVKHPAFVLLSLGGDASFAKFPVASVIAILAHGVAPPELHRWVDGKRAGWGTAEYERVETLRAAKRIGEGEAPSKLVSAMRQIAQALSRSAPISIPHPEWLGHVFFAHYRHASKGVLAEVLGAALATQSRVEALAMLEGLGTHPQATPDQIGGVLGRLLSNRCGAARLFDDVESCAAFAERVFDRADLSNETVIYHCNLPASADEGRDALVRGALRVALRRGCLNDQERRALSGRELTARMALASHDSATPAELAGLARDGDYRVRARVAGRKGLPAELLATLAADDVLVVAQAALGHANAPAGAIRSSLSHPRRAVRRTGAAAASAALLTEVAESLLGEPDGLTRLAVAGRRDAPPELLSALARDKSPTVRRAVAKNPATPQLALDLLANDDSPRVLDGLKKRPKPKASP